MNEPIGPETHVDADAAAPLNGGAIDLSGSLLPHEVAGMRQKSLDPKDFVALSLIGGKTTIVGVDQHGNVVVHIETRVPPDVLEGFKKNILLLPSGQMKAPDPVTKMPFQPELRLIFPTAALTPNAQRQMHASLLIQRQNMAAALAAQARQRQVQHQQAPAPSATNPANPAPETPEPSAWKTVERVSKEAALVAEEAAIVAGFRGKTWASFVYDEDTFVWTVTHDDGTSFLCKPMVQVVNPAIYEGPENAERRKAISEGVVGLVVKEAFVEEEEGYVVVRFEGGVEICIVLVD